MSSHAKIPSPLNDDLAQTLKRTELLHSASSIPGREVVHVLTEIPAGVESGWHQQPGEEVGYILAGTVEMMIEGASTLTVLAGDPFLMPRRTTHATSAPRPAGCCPSTSWRSISQSQPSFDDSGPWPRPVRS